MKIKTDIAERAKTSKMTLSQRSHVEERTRRVMPDGSIQVSVWHNGINYSQRLTPEQLRSSYGNALASYGKKIL